MILVSHRIEEIIPGISHLLVIRNGRVAHAGRRSEVMTPARMKSLSGGGKPLPERPLPTPDLCTATEAPTGPLVEMKNIHVAFGDLVVLQDLNWTVQRGEHWAVVGPNGRVRPPSSA